MITLRLETILIGHIANGEFLTIGSRPRNGALHLQCVHIGRNVLQLGGFLAGNAIACLVRKFVAIDANVTLQLLDNGVLVGAGWSSRRWSSQSDSNDDGENQGGFHGDCFRGFDVVLWYSDRYYTAN